MKWELIVDGDAKKRLRRFPRRDQERIAAALIDMEADPLSGNTVKLRHLYTSVTRSENRASVTKTPQ
jgi:mRNA-degrading endonuclease RelE of RelBE toxin-antitoxin system